MMIRTRMLVLAAAGAAVAVGAASAAPKDAQTLSFVSASQSETFVPATGRETGPQVGARLLFRDVLYNRGAQLGKPSGARIGSAEGVCTIMASTRPLAQCVIT